MKLLKETPTIDRFSLWTDVKPDIESDPRYQAVPNDSLREKWFDEYVKALEDVSCNAHMQDQVSTNFMRFAEVSHEICRSIIYIILLVNASLIISKSGVNLTEHLL